MNAHILLSMNIFIRKPQSHAFRFLFFVWGMSFTATNGQTVKLAEWHDQVTAQVESLSELLLHVQTRAHLTENYIAVAIIVGALALFLILVPLLALVFFAVQRFYFADNPARTPIPDVPKRHHND